MAVQRDVVVAVWRLRFLPVCLHHHGSCSPLARRCSVEHAPRRDVAATGSGWLLRRETVTATATTAQALVRRRWVRDLRGLTKQGALPHEGRLAFLRKTHA